MTYCLIAFDCYSFEWTQGELAAEGIDPAKFREFVEESFDKNNLEQRTEILLLARNGKILFEKYEHGFNSSSKHRVWSITKSFANALYGVMARQGLIHLDQKVTELLPEFNRNKNLQAVTIRHLLQMNSGIAWNESYINPISSHVIKMLYGPAKLDMGGYAVEVAVDNKIDAPAGEKFKYSSGTSNLLMYLFKKIIGPSKLHDVWPWQNLFHPIGMHNVTWEQDHAGSFVGSSYLFTSARDLARFGQLFLNKGKFDGKEILSAEWVEHSISPSKASTVDNEWYGYGMHFWTNQHADGRLAHDFLPRDTIFSLGHNGQILMLIPSMQLILIRLAHDTSRLDRKQFFNSFWKSVKVE